MIPYPNLTVDRIGKALGAGGVSFFAIELTTGHAVLAALSAIAAALLAQLPTLLRDKHAREASEQAQHVTWLEQRIRYHSQCVMLIRTSKHNVLNHLGEVQAYTGKLREMLRDKGIDPPAFHFKHYDELCGDEDRALALLALPAEVRESSKG